MFVYLSKKIAIPNNTPTPQRINCLAWNKEEGYIAVGGEDGLLKVLKLEQVSNVTSTNKGGLAAPSNLSVNQTLEGHKAPIQVVTWNEKQQKLTTSDRDGVIMVWMLYKNSWFEEMTNDRKKSTVKGMHWTDDGQKICIVYEDGAVIVGNVDGNRIWGKELKNTVLTGVQWSPDGRLLLFSIRNGEVHLYDNQGTFVMKLNIQCVNLGPSRSLSVVGLCWYHGKISQQRPTLAICYENGRLQLMRNENDDLPIIIDAGMQAIACDWNHDGTILGVCGMSSSGIDEKESNMVKFYTPTGEHLRTLKLPGKEITSISWEGKSLRIALGVDSFIYFANIRPNYMWCYFGKTVVYLEADSGKISSNMVFWDTSSNQCFTKQIDKPLGLASNNDHCVIAIESSSLGVPRDTSLALDREKIYQLVICNCMSTTVDARYVNICPKFITMNSTYVIVASQDQFLLWHYHTPKGASSLHGMKQRKDKKFHIDDTPAGVAEVLNDLDRAGYEPPVSEMQSHDPICCIAASERLLLIGRESGAIQEYTIPNVALCNRHILPTKACKISINCNSTRAAVIDSTGFLTTLDLSDGAENGGIHGKVERKDVWAMCWAKDNPLLLAIMEKTRMYVLRGADPEEPISFSGYICNFDDLEITGVLLDDIINGMSPDTNTHLCQLRIKSLRDTEELLAHVGITEARQFIEDNSHPRLWRLLAEASLKKLDLETAESAFVRSTNYPGLQLIKRLKTIENENLKKAEVAAFYQDFDEAEKLYIDADRRDLAINLRQTLCDWFRTVQLYRQGLGVSDQQMNFAYKEIGSHFANLRSWESAKEYYEKAHDIEGLMDSLYHLEQYAELEECIQKLPEKSALLMKLGQMLESVGMCDQAVSAYLKFGDPKAAVNACVNLRNWKYAVELAQKYPKLAQVGQLLDKHAAQLLMEEKLPEAIELQKKAGRLIDAGRLMIKLAEREVEKKSSLLRVKQLYILAGMLVEEHLKNQSVLTGENRSTVLTNLTPEDAVLIENIWHRAEGFHFMLLAQRQLNGGLMHSAVLTCLRLREYEDVLDTEEIYTLLALASCADRSFGTCSKAFIKLESLENVPEHRVQEYEELAVSIFSKHEPKDDTRMEQMVCYTCESIISDYFTSCSSCGTHLPACIASGQSIANPTEAWQCTGCHHLANRLDVATRKTCPLCHTTIVSRGIEL
ncbi:WD repeat-containing protein 35 [Culicoides brevitarsis]|uniref:WD repeat-containing protein 35 n=1 Tax=Culicoides brevitarsis TaxID=469753 RepID=UPI00307B60A8